MKTDVSKEIGQIAEILAEGTNDVRIKFYTELKERIEIPKEEGEDLIILKDAKITIVIYISTEINFKSLKKLAFLYEGKENRRMTINNDSSIKLIILEPYEEDD